VAWLPSAPVRLILNSVADGTGATTDIAQRGVLRARLRRLNGERFGAVVTAEGRAALWAWFV